MEILIFYVPCANKKSASALVDQLLDKRLIACGNVIKSESLYRWKGELNSETEYVALMKTTTELEADVESAIQADHSYDVPCIARWAIRVNHAYGNWVCEEVSSDH